MESNHKSNLLDENQWKRQVILASRAMEVDTPLISVSNRVMIVSGIINDLQVLADDLIDNPVKRERWMRDHPIVRFLMFRLKCDVLVNPDVEYFRTRNQLRDMTDVAA
jgi:glycyl-tRNA synthetase (class II)